MKNYKSLFVGISFFVMLLVSQPTAAAEDFPLSIKGWQATVIRLEGVNTSRAMAAGQVRKRNAEEYCDREAEWSKNKSGRKISKERCIRDVLRKERGKFYSISADCPGKLLRSNIGSFTLTGQSSENGLTQNIWRNNGTGEVLDGSNASGAPLLDAQFELLCPAFVKP
jgi:hypothetical protein